MTLSSIDKMKTNQSEFSHLANWLLHSGHWQVYGFSPEQDFIVSTRNTVALAPEVSEPNNIDIYTRFAQHHWSPTPELPFVTSSKLSVPNFTTHDSMTSLHEQYHGHLLYHYISQSVSLLLPPFFLISIPYNCDQDQ